VYLNYKTGKDYPFKLHILAQDEYVKINHKFINYLFEAGFNDIRLLPAINHDDLLKKRYFGEYANFGCADALADNKYIEFKEVKRGKKRRRNIIDAIAKALKKSDIVFLRIEGEIKTEQVNLIGSKEIKKYPHKKIYLIDNEDNIYTFSSP
jgi:hypothetical protein